MIQIFLLMAGTGGMLAGILVILALAALFVVSGCTCAIIMELYPELYGEHLNLNTGYFLLFILITAIVILILSELGPICRVVGKTFIFSQFALLIYTYITWIFKSLENYYFIASIVILIIGFALSLRSTEGFVDFILDHPILSIISSIPASVFVFIDSFLIIHDFTSNQDILDIGKKSLLITLITFAVFTTIEIIIMIKNKNL